MQTHQPTNQKYTALGGIFQPSLPLNLEIRIPEDDPVRLLRYCIGGMDISALERTYRRIDRNLASPRQMLAILVYAGMNRIFSSRRIETACRRDINFMYLLEGKPAPDHATIARFRSKHLAPCIKELFAQMDFLLLKFGVISMDSIFIDGTKIESVANKYKFVWKKTVLKNRNKLLAKLPDFVAKINRDLGLNLYCGKGLRLHDLKKIRRRLRAMQKQEKISFVHGIGKRKTLLQRDFEQLDGYIRRFKDYFWKLHTCGSRNSFAKTDTDATFMRMKEDAMRNGQLKPAYNVQYGIDSEFVTWVTVGPQPTDTTTLKPFLMDLENHLYRNYRNIVADAGYESEENYTYLEQNQQYAFIKPNNYEKSRTRKWRKDIGRRENMTYMPEQDVYECANHKLLRPEYVYHSKTGTGYISEKTVYGCSECLECPLKPQCIHGNHWKKKTDERYKHLTVAKKFIRQREDDLKRITTSKGILLRINRTIQSEGTFADIKADLNFRRFLSKGNANVLVESMLLAMSHNLLKFHQKIQAGNTYRHLLAVDKVA